MPDAILGASIFFDMRPVHGDATLHARLQRHVLTASPGSKVFLAHLAKQATANEPPLGFFRGLVLRRRATTGHTLDIKRGGIGAVVELARVHALSVGSPAVNTRARIQAASEAGILGDERADDLRDAFEFISYVRLRHQVAQVRRGEPPDNFVAPGDLSSFDKRHLREAFAIVRAAAVGARAPLPDAVHLVNLFRRTPEQRRLRALRSAGPGPLRDYLEVALPGLGTPLADLRLLAVDIETTGLDPRRDRVLSIGWVPVDCGRSLLGGAGRVVVRDEGGAGGVGQSATVHGLTDDTLAGGVPLEDAVARLLEALAGRVLLAHFARIETGFLASACERAWGLGCRASSSTPSSSSGARWPGLGAATGPGALRLWAARERRGLPVYRAHEALTDALACAELYLAQCAELAGAVPGDDADPPPRGGVRVRCGGCVPPGRGQKMRAWLDCAIRWISYDSRAMSRSAWALQPPPWWRLVRSWEAMLRAFSRDRMRCSHASSVRPTNCSAQREFT